MKVEWQTVGTLPERYGTVWLWWPGLYKPIVGEFVYSKPTPIFRTDDWGVRDEVTHWAPFEWPDVPEQL